MITLPLPLAPCLCFPTCPNHQTAAVTSFVREHVVQRADSLQMLAVRHGVSVPCLKRVNNLMSDHALHSRTQLYIPGGQQRRPSSSSLPLRPTHCCMHPMLGCHAFTHPPCACTVLGTASGGQQTTASTYLC